jgi:hypothetical protein
MEKEEIEKDFQSVNGGCKMCGAIPLYVWESWNYSMRVSTHFLHNISNDD